jgi:hypothetical protein
MANPQTTTGPSRSPAGAAPGVFPGIQVNTNVFFNTRQKSYDFRKIMIIFVK